MKQVCKICCWANAPYAFTNGLCRECSDAVATAQRSRTKCDCCGARFIQSWPRQGVCHNCREASSVLRRRRAKAEDARLDKQMRARAAADPAYRAAVNAVRSLAPSIYGYEDI